MAVEPGYLNYSAPSIEDAARRCVKSGARVVVVAPYFLVAGKFVREDLPARLGEVRKLFPDVRFLLAGPLGDHPAMGAGVTDVLNRADYPQQWQAQAIGKALEECELRKDCPLYGSAMCRASEAVVGSNNEAVVIEGATNLRALMLVLHGSPRPEANEPALKLSQRLRDSGDFHYVIVAYLECNEPSISDALRQCAEAGANQAVVVPYFLHTGRHLVLDIPNLLIQAQKEHPRMEILLCDAVGTSPAISQALQARAAEALA